MLDLLYIIYARIYRNRMSGMKFLDLNAQLPDELVPFADKLGPNFMAVRKKVVAFAIEECLPMVPRYTREMEENVKKVGDPLLAPQPPCFKELQQKAKDRGLWNFFLFGGGGLNCSSRVQTLPVLLRVEIIINMIVK